MATSKLTLRNTECVYPDGTRALHPCNLEIVTGRFTVLLGPSGAGKSTLLRMLNGLVKPTGGSVLAEGIGNIAAGKAMRQLRRRTGMIFQQHHLIGRISVLENVLIGRLAFHGSLRTLFDFSKAEKEMALAAIERVGLLNEALKRADQLSGGQQQRVGIARALVQQPQIILADEPVASLDPATARSVLQLLSDICRGDGLTAVVSLHQVDLAREFADRIIGLQGGRIVFDGAPAALDEKASGQIYERLRVIETAAA